MPLTDAKLKSLKPKAKAYKLADFDGLYVYVSKTGSKLWRFKFRLDGKEGLLSFGRYPDISLSEARDLRDDARRKVAKGINPAKAKQAAKTESLEVSAHTFAKLSEKYLIKLVKEGKSEQTMKKKEWLLCFANADFGDVAMNDITAQMVLATLKKREKEGHYETARRLRSTIGAVFRYAVALGVADTDPTFSLRDALIRPTVKHRAAITDKAKLSELLKALKTYGGQAETRIGLELLILFASRPGELRKARWEEFDFENRIFRIPAERMKMRRPHEVPLSDRALALLAELKELTGWGDLLFPAQTSSQKPISENTLNQALRRMGFTADEVTSHGFRSTFSTFANESGLFSPDVIEAYCARQDKNAVRRAYNRSVYWDERVKLADWWAGEINSAYISHP